MTHGVLLMFDAGNTPSFDSLIGWREKIDESCCDAVLLLVASRADTYGPTEKLWVKGNIDGLAKDLHCEVGYAVCSAKTDTFERIDSVFMRLIDASYEHMMALESGDIKPLDDAPMPARYDTVDLTPSPRVADDGSAPASKGSKKGFRCLV
jgi:hypothetical protein